MDAVTNAAQVLIIVVDIPHCRADAAAAGAVAALASMLKPASEDAVSQTEEVAAILLSKLVLEPDTHTGIAKAGAIPTLVSRLTHGLLLSTNSCCQSRCLVRRDRTRSI